MFKISIPQRNLVLMAEPQKNLMDLLIENQLPVASSCLGEGICSKCVVQVDPIGKKSDFEINTLTKNKRDSNDRLSCQIHIECDLVVKTTYW